MVREEAPIGEGYLMTEVKEEIKGKVDWEMLVKQQEEEKKKRREEKDEDISLGWRC